MKISPTLLTGAGIAAAVWLLRPRAPFPPWARPEQRGGAQALITGASAGMGTEFARQLAGRGYNLVLVARRAERLEKLAAELEATYHIRAEVLAADLSNDEGVRQVEERIGQLAQLEVLVNNAGFGTGGSLAKANPQRQQDMLYLHVMAAMRLTQAALPGMQGRGRGGIINVSSVAAFTPLPRNVNYHASKAYLVAFSTGLQSELNDSGVFVQALCPGFTVTEFHSTDDFEGFDKRSSPAFLWMDATDVVRESLNELGSGRVIVVPGLLYKTLVLFLRTPLLGDMMLRVASQARKASPKLSKP